MGNKKGNHREAVSQKLIEAVRDNNIHKVKVLIDEQPELLHERMPNADGGGPLSYAAQCNHMELVELLLKFGAKDLQQALSRACMKANDAVAEFLVKKGADPNGLYADNATHYGPVILAACEALNPDGLRLILSLGADPNVKYRTSDGKVNSPFGFLLGGYMRQPQKKHECLKVLLDAGCIWEDTPITALHQGRLDLLKQHFRKNPDLLHRRFESQDLYFSEKGFSEAAVFAPIEGTTLLHLSIEYDEFDIASWLLERGADVNGRADCYTVGSAGHTPLFHAVLACASPSDKRTQFLLDYGADPAIRATIRHPDNGWKDRAGNVFENVTALDYALQFSNAPDWCNRDSIQLLKNLDSK